MSTDPMLTGAIAKISTQTAGGWKIALDVPESMSEVVRQLLGSENRVLYNITFAESAEIAEIGTLAKRSPGRPKARSSEEEA